MFKNLPFCIRPTHWGLIGLFLAADYVIVSLLHVLYASRILYPIAKATGGLIDYTLMGHTIPIAGVIGIILVWLGKRRANEIGLVGRNLLPGLLFTAAFWLVIQVTQLLFGLILHGAITLHPDWTSGRATVVIGAVIGQLLGNALYEEVAYRGFLFSQLWLLFGQRWPGQQAKSFLAALLISQVLFSLRHIPRAIAQDFTVEEAILSFFFVALIGILYALLYLRTGNLFLVVGIHALTDAPTPLFATALVDSYWLVHLYALITLLAWPAFALWRGKRAQQGAPHLTLLDGRKI